MPKTAFDAIKHWQRHAHQLREGLLNRVEELSVSDYPEVTAHQVIRFLLAFYRELEHRINKSGTEAELRFICQLIESHGVFLEWLDNAHTGQTPRALAQLLKVLMDRLEPQSGVVAVPRANYNYSIINLGFALKTYVQQWVPQSRHHIFEEFTQAPMKLICFPRIERDNIVTHAVFGHELGHPIATEFLDAERTDPAHQAEQTEIQKKVAAFVQSMMPGQNDPTKELRLKTQIMNKVLQVRLRAIEELVSDYVGFLIFGASAVFAMHDLLWTGDWDAPPAAEEWYPPSRMRLRLMLDHMEASNAIATFAKGEDKRAQEYGASVLSFVEQAKQIVAVPSDQDKIKADPVLSIAYEWMEKGLPKAFEFAKNRVKDVLFDMNSVVRQLPELLHRLELGVPPNETGDSLNPQSVDFRASILAAWIYKIHGQDSTGNVLSAEALDKLNLQTLLAVEYVILRDKYGDHLAASSANGAAS